MARKCVRFKMTPSGRRCASFAGKARTARRRRRSMSGMEGIDELAGTKRHCTRYKRVRLKSGKYVRRCVGFKKGRGAPSARARRKAGIKRPYRAPKRTAAKRRATGRRCTRFKRVNGVRRCASFSGKKRSAKGRSRAAARTRRRARRSPSKTSRRTRGAGKNVSPRRSAKMFAKPAEATAHGVLFPMVSQRQVSGLSAYRRRGRRR